MRNDSVRPWEVTRAARLPRAGPANGRAEARRVLQRLAGGYSSGFDPPAEKRALDHPLHDRIT